MNRIIWFFIFNFCVMNSEQAIIDTRHKNTETCPICQSMAKERCQTGGKTDALCHKIAHESCPTKLLHSKPHELPAFSDEDMEEFLEVKATRKQKEDRKGVLDLVNGILLAVHTSTKADLRRAKEKELKDEIYKKVATI